MSKTNPRLIDIDEYVEWYNNFYKNSPSQCVVNREAIYVMDRDGFKIDSVVDFPTTNVPKLFFYAFRMHHRKMQKAPKAIVPRAVSRKLSQPSSP